MSWSGWMIRAFGAVGVLLGAVWTCQEQVRRERKCIRQLRGLSEALSAMERELRERSSAMEVLLREAQRVGGEELSRIFGRITLKNLETADFSTQWNNMASNTALHLNQAERQLLERPGRVLGRCSVEEQCQCLASVGRELRERAGAREAALRERRRLWYTLSVSAALLAVVTLL